MGVRWALCGFKGRGLEGGRHYAIQCNCILGKLVLYWSLKFWLGDTSLVKKVHTLKERGRIWIQNVF